MLKVSLKIMLQFLFLFFLTASASRLGIFNQKEFCGPVRCTACKSIVQMAESVLLENNTQIYLDNLCKIIPAEYKDVCDYAIENEYPIVVQFIENKYTPETVCTDLKYC